MNLSFSPSNDKTSETNPGIPLEDTCQICFKGPDPLPKKAGAIIVPMELFGIYPMSKLMDQLASQFPDTPIIVAGDKNIRYGSFWAMVENYLVNQQFFHDTGLPPGYIKGKTEGEIIKSIFSERSWAFYNVREKFKIPSVYDPDRIHAVGGTNYYGNMIEINQELDRCHIAKDSLILIAPIHAHRSLMTARKVFPDSQITFAPYTWKTGNLVFNEETVLGSTKNMSWRDWFMLGRGKGILYGEVKRILKYSQEGYLTMPDEVMEIYNKYLRTPLVSQKKENPKTNDR